MRESSLNASMSSVVVSFAMVAVPSDRCPAAGAASWAGGSVSACRRMAQAATSADSSSLSRSASTVRAA
jgi:hypothetical protein